jgi:uncharacterized protein YdiU (UPF0061 family)
MHKEPIPHPNIQYPMSSPTFNFTNTYTHLPPHFYARVNPTPVASPTLIKLNVDLALQLNLDPAALATPAGVEILAGNRIAPGSEPLAIAYAGHQFGHFVPQLGDGRANLLGEVLARDGHLYDIQLKGSGPTPFSRRGDGRAALGPVLREYLLSEAMAALGVPTTRALAAVLTGQPVFRETAQPGAVFTRVAASHLRVGTFQFFAARQDTEGLRQLADFAINRHFPEALQADKPYLSFLTMVIKNQATLIAQWMLLGFIHGVMNTDNTSISGETIDYGPCAFMEAYNPEQVFSSIDQQGRYAYTNQPHAAHWNLTRLAEALLPLLTLEAGTEESAIVAIHEALATFGPEFETAYLNGMRRKLGLFTERDADKHLAQDLLDRMAANHADFTLTFRRLSEPEKDVRSLFDDPRSYDEWATLWRQRLAEEANTEEARIDLMQSVNPAYIPRNHQVEAIIRAAVDRNDFEPFHQLLDVVTHPYTERPNLDRYTLPATHTEQVRLTFCGT